MRHIWLLDEIRAVDVMSRWVVSKIGIKLRANASDWTSGVCLLWGRCFGCRIKQNNLCNKNKTLTCSPESSPTLPVTAMRENDRTRAEGGDDNRSTHPTLPLDHQSLSEMVYIKFQHLQNRHHLHPKWTTSWKTHISTSEQLYYGCSGQWSLSDISYRLDHAGGFDGSHVSRAPAGASVRPLETSCSCDLRQTPKTR